MKKTGVLFFALLFLCSYLQAQSTVSASASVDKASILIGQPLRLTIEATFSKPHTPSFVTLDSLPHFEILTRSKVDTQAVDAQVTLKQTFTLTSWDSGAWMIPALSITTVKGGTTKPVPVNVLFTPMQPDQEYHEIKDILDVPKPPRETWYWYVIGAVLLLLMLLLVFPKKKKAPVAEAAASRESAYKNALKALDVLKSKSNLDDKEYFTELIQIFRTYLQQGKGIHSFQQTTDDLGRQLQTLQLPHEGFKKLVHTLQLSDMVKFARYKATGDERGEALDETKKSIVAIEQLIK